MWCDMCVCCECICVVCVVRVIYIFILIYYLLLLTDGVAEVIHAVMDEETRQWLSDVECDVGYNLISLCEIRTYDETMTRR